jgi:hypothetical protein
MSRCNAPALIVQGQLTTDWQSGSKLQMMAQHCMHISGFDFDRLLGTVAVLYSHGLVDMHGVDPVPAFSPQLR